MCGQKESAVQFPWKQEPLFASLTQLKGKGTIASTLEQPAGFLGRKHLNWWPQWVRVTEVLELWASDPWFGLLNWSGTCSAPSLLLRVRMSVIERHMITARWSDWSQLKEVLSSPENTTIPSRLDYSSSNVCTDSPDDPEYLLTSSSTELQH